MADITYLIDCTRLMNNYDELTRILDSLLRENATTIRKRFSAISFGKNTAVRTIKQSIKTTVFLVTRGVMCPNRQMQNAESLLPLQHLMI